MNLQIIAGPSGAGKSTYIYRRIVDEAQRNPKKHYLILVPLQYSMQTQRILVFLHPRRSIMNIDVLSFERLAYRVFDELGTKKTQCLDETGKVLLLRHAAAMIRDDLGILKRNIGHRGYIDEVKSLISELMQYGYTPDDVSSMASGEALPATFREKAEDIEKLYREFLALLDESMFTQEQALSLLCEVADRSELLRDSVIVLDGYTGFTPVQKELLGRIFPLVDTVYACITCDPDTDLYNKGSEEGLFHMSREESSFLISLAGEHLCDPVIIDRGRGRFTDSAEMAFLEQHIFREDGSTMSLSGGVKENGLCDTAASLIRTRNVNTELLYTAEKIHELVRTEKGLHYRDIAVVCPDVEAYRYSIERVYAASGIPVFLDERKQTQFNPLTELVDAALDMVKRRLSYETVMRFLRSGLTPLTVDETDILDDYLYEAAFRNTTYLSKPFVRHTQDFHREEDLEKVEAIRAKLAEPLMRFYDAEKSKTATVTQRLTALFGLLTDFDAERKLLERASSKEEAGDMVSADLYRRMYGFLCDLSDQMVSLLGDERMNVSDFRDMLLDGLDAVKPATVPKSNDAVAFGDLERTRLSDVKVLFLIGAGDDQIPRSTDSGGIFSQEERTILADEGYELAPTDEQKSIRQRFYLYLVLTKARERIYISYHEAGDDDSGVGESYLFEEMRKLFPGLSTREVRPDDPVFLETENSADIVMTRGIRDMVNSGVSSDVKDRTVSLLEVKSISGREDERRAFTRAAFFENAKTPLQKAVTEALYGKNLLMSVSRLETFAECAYTYFLQYGLRLRARKRNEFASLDLGNLYHGALEKYARGLKDAGLTWDSLSEADMQARLLESFRAELGIFSDTEIFADAREGHFSRQAFSNLLFNTGIMTEQIRAGSFVPAYFEQELTGFSDPSDLTVPIGDGRTLSLTGKIDRIDIASGAGACYVKIIDYKTGKNRLDPTKIYAGIQLQLLVYLNAAIDALGRRTDRKVLPGAVFYYHIKDSRIDETTPLTDLQLHDLLEKDLRPSGIVLNDSAVISALDAKLSTESGYYSPFVSINTKKDGSIGASGSLLEEDSFNELRLFTRDKAASLGNSIASGITDINPYRTKNGSACKYCVYKGVCHFDTRLRGFYYRDIADSLSDSAADDGGRKQGASLKALIARIVAEKEEKK